MKNVRMVVMLAVIATLFAASGAFAQSSRIAEENAVILALIDSLYQGSHRYVLTDSTRVRWTNSEQYDRRARLAKSLDNDSAALADFETINRISRSLGGVGPSSVPFEIVHDSVFANFPDGPLMADGKYVDHYWDTFHARFPGRHGKLNVSRPGFNGDRTVAIVEATMVCGGLCGGGGLYILRRKDGLWRITGGGIMVRF